MTIQNLSSNPLGYLGDLGIPYIQKPTDPLPSDTASIPTVWDNTLTGACFIYSSVTHGWLPITGGMTSGIQTINDILPDGTNNFGITAGSSITITPEANSIQISASSSPSAGVLTLSANNMGEATPDGSGNILVQGAGSISTAVIGFSPHTMTISLSNITTNSAATIGSTSNTIVGVPLGNGQLLVGSAGIAPVAANITPGNGINIVNSAGGIAINSTAIDTINGIAPNSGNNFSVNAGTGITITPGTNAISIASSGGGGGFTSINEYLFTTNGMYVPAVGASTILVEIVGGGGGGGNVSGATNYGAGGGGGGGEWASGGYPASMQPIMIGQGGVGGSAGNPTSFGGSLLSANGGQPGTSVMSNTPANGGVGGGGGSGSSFRVQGGSGGTGFGVDTISPAFMLAGKGGDSKLGFGAQGYSVGSGSPGVYNGNLGQKFGGGGSGGIVFGTSGSAIGGTGASGVVYIIEYCT